MIDEIANENHRSSIIVPLLLLDEEFLDLSHELGVLGLGIGFEEQPHLVELVSGIEAHLVSTIIVRLRHLLDLLIHQLGQSFPHLHQLFCLVSQKLFSVVYYPDYCRP